MNKINTIPIRTFTDVAEFKHYEREYISQGFVLQPHDDVDMQLTVDFKASFMFELMLLVVYIYGYLGFRSTQ